MIKESDMPPGAWQCFVDPVACRQGDSTKPIKTGGKPAGVLCAERQVQAYGFCFTPRPTEQA